VTVEDLLSLIRKGPLKSRPTIIAHLNLHGAFLYHQHEQMRQLHQAADMVYLDGMPVVFWAKLLGLGASPHHRVTFLDYKAQLFSLADELSWRVFYLGGKPGVPQRAAQQLAETYQNMTIQCHHGYLAAAEDRERIVAQIRDFRPQLVLVGMGMPIQETWILENHQHFGATTIMAVGAGFDYLAGEISTPSRWLGRIGLEWLHRLCAEPRRLSYRYLVEPWYLLPYGVRDLLSYRLEMNPWKEPPSRRGAA